MGLFSFIEVRADRTTPTPRRKGTLARISAAACALGIVAGLTGCKENEAPAKPKRDAAAIQGAALDGSSTPAATTAAPAATAAAPATNTDSAPATSPASAAPAPGSSIAESVSAAAAQVATAAGATTGTRVQSPSTGSAEKFAQASANFAAVKAASSATPPPIPAGGADAGVESDIDVVITNNDPAVVAAAASAPQPRRDNSPKPDKDLPDYTKLAFSYLSNYEYVLQEDIPPRPVPAGGGPIPTPTAIPNQVPQTIQAFTGKKVAIWGYMLPVKYEKDKIRTFLLLNNQMFCCFGVAPKMNEWVYVKVDPKRPVEYVPDVPVKVYGTFEVGEEIKDGMVVSLYRMVADSLKPMQ